MSEPLLARSSTPPNKPVEQLIDLHRSFEEEVHLAAKQLPLLIVFMKVYQFCSMAFTFVYIMCQLCFHSNASLTDHFLLLLPYLLWGYLVTKFTKNYSEPWQFDLHLLPLDSQKTSFWSQAQPTKHYLLLIFLNLLVFFPAIQLLIPQIAPGNWRYLLLGQDVLCLLISGRFLVKVQKAFESLLSFYYDMQKKQDYYIPIPLGVVRKEHFYAFEPKDHFFEPSMAKIDSDHNSEEEARETELLIKETKSPSMKAELTYKDQDHAKEQNYR